MCMLGCVCVFMCMWYRLVTFRYLFDFLSKMHVLPLCLLLQWLLHKSHVQIASMHTNDKVNQSISQVVVILLGEDAYVERVSW